MTVLLEYNGDCSIRVSRSTYKGTLLQIQVAEKWSGPALKFIALVIPLIGRICKLQNAGKTNSYCGES